MDVFRKAFLAGLGAFSLSRERMQTLVEELVQQGTVKEKEGSKLLGEMMKKAEAARKDVEHAVRGHAQTTIQKMNLATQEQLKKLEKQIRILEAALARAASKPATAKPTASRTTKSGASRPKPKARKK